MIVIGGILVLVGEVGRVIPVDIEEASIPGILVTGGVLVARVGKPVDTAVVVIVGEVVGVDGLEEPGEVALRDLAEGEGLTFIVVGGVRRNLNHGGSDGAVGVVDEFVEVVGVLGAGLHSSIIVINSGAGTVVIVIVTEGHGTAVPLDLRVHTGGVLNTPEDRGGLTISDIGLVGVFRAGEPVVRVLDVGADEALLLFGDLVHEILHGVGATATTAANG